MHGSKERSGRGWGARAASLAIAFTLAMASPAAAHALDQRCEQEIDRDVPERLAGKARQAAERGVGWRLAGELMLQSAWLHPECALERQEALRAAATYFRFAGDYERASDISYEAGEQSVWNGRVTEAADAFIDAATYALEAGDEMRLLQAATHASRLAGSPHLTQIQRLVIRGRADRLLERRADEISRRRPGPGW